MMRIMQGFSLVPWEVDGVWAASGKVIVSRD